MTIRSRHKKFSSQHWLLSICDGSCIIWRVDHSNVTTAGVTNYRNMWRISSTVTKGLDILWRPSIFRHAVLFVSFVLWRQRDDHFFVTNFFLWQYLPLTWRLRFVIQSQNSCSECRWVGASEPCRLHLGMLSSFLFDLVVEFFVVRLACTFLTVARCC